MAKRTVEYMLSDLSGEDGASTVNFGLDGASYEVDLTDAEAKEFRDFLTRYADAGRKVAGSRRPTSGTQKKETAAIRQWASEQGIEVPARGRIPNEIIRKFEESKSAAPSSTESGSPSDSSATDETTSDDGKNSNKEKASAKS